jgi:hypothetical protein
MWTVKCMAVSCAQLNKKLTRTADWRTLATFVRDYDGECTSCDAPDPKPGHRVRFRHAADNHCPGWVDQVRRQIQDPGSSPLPAAVASVHVIAEEDSAVDFVAADNQALLFGHRCNIPQLGERENGPGWV